MINLFGFHANGSHFKEVKVKKRSDNRIVLLLHQTKWKHKPGKPHIGGLWFLKRVYISIQGTTGTLICFYSFLVYMKGDLKKKNKTVHWSLSRCSIFLLMTFHLFSLVFLYSNFSWFTSNFLIFYCFLLDVHFCDTNQGDCFWLGQGHSSAFIWCHWSHF